MTGTWAVARREFTSYFTTPVGYVILATFAIIAGLGFTSEFLAYARATQAPATYGYTGVPDLEEQLLSPYLVFCGVLIMFMGPLITMRLLAEERSRGTMELLLTHPLRDRDIVFGKYLASLGMLCAMLAVIGVHLLVIDYFSDIEPAVLVFGVFTVFLMGAAFLSLGLFVSSTAKSQVTAGMITFGLWFVSYVLGTYSKELPDANPAPAEWPESAQSAVYFIYSVFRRFAQELPLDAHAIDMAQGIVRPNDVAYYVLFIAFFLFLTFRSLESRRWRA